MMIPAEKNGPVGYRWSPAELVYLTPCFAIALVGIACQFLYLPNDDATWLIMIARRLHSGATLYSQDLVEINPPLIIQLTAMTVRWSTWLHLEAITGWRLFVGSQILLSLWLSSLVLKAVVGRRGVDLRVPLLMCLAWIVAILPRHDYGQREHLILLWLLPYVLLAGGRVGGIVPGRRWRIVGGALMGLAVCLKPHYILLPLLVEAGMIVRQGSIRAVRGSGISVAAICGLAYVVSVYLWYPGFFSFAVPLSLQYYSSYGSLTFHYSHLAYLGAALVALVATRSPQIAVAECWAAAWAGIGCFLAFVLQGKGWRYHFLPSEGFFDVALAIALVSNGLMLTSWITGRRGRTVHPAAIVSLAVAAVSIAAVGAVHSARLQHESRQDRVVRNIRTFIEHIDTGPEPRRFVALSLTLSPAFPVNELLHAEWSSRFSCFWIVPGILEAEQHSDPGGDFGRRYLEDAVSDDFERWRPQIVMVERVQPVSVLDELLRNARFQTLWHQYKPVGVVESFEVFRLVTEAPHVNTRGGAE